MNRPSSTRYDPLRQNGASHNGSTPHVDDPPEESPVEQMKPGVHGIQPGWLAVSMAAGALLWMGMIALARRISRR